MFGELPPPASCDKLVQMDLKLKPEVVGHKIRRRPYPAPKEQADEIEREIQECINAGLVLEYKDGDYPQHCSPCRKFYSDFNTVCLLCLSCCLLLV